MFDKLLENLSEKQRMVYPEGTDPRIIGAAVRLVKEGEISAILLGDEEEIKRVAGENKLDLDQAGIEIINHKTADITEMKEKFLEIRKGKNTEDEAEEMLRNQNYFATMMVKMGQADAMIAGAVSSTGDTIRPALQIIKTKEGNSRISGAMLMIGPGGEKYIFADIAINISHEPEGLAELAYQSAQTAKLFRIDPKIAFLSFSTKGSAPSEEAQKVIDAVKIAKDKYKDLCIDGEMQFDAAIDSTVAELKAPDSPVAGQANVFIFPDLNAGNIGYKIAQRLGGYEAIGPILQGLAAPIADLSRGCSEEDVYKLSIITALQAQNN